MNYLYQKHYITPPSDQQLCSSNHPDLKLSTIVPVENFQMFVEAKVYTKVIHVTYLAEFPWRYRSISKKNEVCGMLLVIFTNNMSLKHNSCFIFSYYTLFSGKKKGKELNIYSVSKVEHTHPIFDQFFGQNPRFQYWNHWRWNSSKSIPIWHNNNIPEISDYYCGGYRFIQVRKNT